jgi:hypothetical protein
MSALDVALIYPPVTDPTSGYHSLSYLDTYARSRGLPAADIIDANIEAFHHSYTDAAVADLRDAMRRPLKPDALGYYRTAQLRAELLGVNEPDPDAVRAAVATMQDPDRFYDYEQYRQAVETISGWMNCLGSIGFPGQFAGGFLPEPPPPVMAGSTQALRHEPTIARLNRPFAHYYENSLLPRLVGRYDVIGVNVTYQYQLPFALWLMRLIRQAMPDVFLMAGGTEVSDTWKYLADRTRLFDLFADLDAVVIGEGETAYEHILESRAAGRLPTGHANVRLHPRHGAVRALPLVYEPIRELPTPDFSGLPWDSYLSPERFVYYSPTRGCYWNKCTFCDYGLNGDSPTSPWRQNTVDLMVRDVTALSKEAKFVYFSVDVLAPAAILRFAEQVVERGIDVRWGAEIRLEKYWSSQRCELLKKAGCTAVSVGFESGNQRILDLIDKGITPAQVRGMIESMTNAGIGVQMMAFTGFPSETQTEAMDTMRFLQDNRDLWTYGGVGDFVLTSGAIVAKQPARFGIDNVRPIPDADIHRVLLYDDPAAAGVDRQQLEQAKAALDCCDYQRPWMTATDTPHTFFYHDRYGTGVRALTGAQPLTDADRTAQFVVNGEFVDRPDDALLSIYRDSHGLFAGDTPPAGFVLFRRIDGELFLFPPVVRKAVACFAEPVALATALARAWTTHPDRLWRLYDSLVASRVLRRVRRISAPASEVAAVAVGWRCGETSDRAGRS